MVNWLYIIFMHSEPCHCFNSFGLSSPSFQIKLVNPYVCFYPRPSWIHDITQFINVLKIKFLDAFLWPRVHDTCIDSCSSAFLCHVNIQFFMPLLFLQIHGSFNLLCGLSLFFTPNARRRQKNKNSMLILGLRNNICYSIKVIRKTEPDIGELWSWNSCA